MRGARVALGFENLERDLDLGLRVPVCQSAVSVHLADSAHANARFLNAQLNGQRSAERIGTAPPELEQLASQMQRGSHPWCAHILPAQLREAAVPVLDEARRPVRLWRAGARIR